MTSLRGSSVVFCLSFVIYFKFSFLSIDVATLFQFWKYSFEVVVFCTDMNIETYSLNVFQESGWQCKHGIPDVFLNVFQESGWQCRPRH